MRSFSGIGRAAAVAAVAAAVAVVAILLFGGGGGYTVKARFLNAGQLVKGNPVQTGGVPIGSVTGIRITSDGHDLAKPPMTIDEGQRWRLLNDLDRRSRLGAGRSNRLGILRDAPHAL